jgi:hypothetical protein
LLFRLQLARGEFRESATRLSLDQIAKKISSVLFRSFPHLQISRLHLEPQLRLPIDEPRPACRAEFNWSCH